MISLLEDKIIHTKLTKTGYRIAEYLLQNESRLCFMTALAVASEIGVSDASIIRVTRALGFDGFSDMQRHLREKASDVLTGNSSEEISPLGKLERHGCSDGQRIEELVQRCRDTAIESLQGVIENNNIKKFEDAAHLIENSQKKLICGFRSSSSPASFFGLQLALMLPNVHGSFRADSFTIDNMMYLSSEDCVVLFTFPRYFRMSKVVAEMAKDKGARLIIVTDRASSPIANGADIVISAKAESMSIFSSMIGAQFAAELLIAIVNRDIGSENKPFLEWKEKYNTKYGVFVENEI